MTALEIIAICLAIIGFLLIAFAFLFIVPEAIKLIRHSEKLADLQRKVVLGKGLTKEEDIWLLSEWINSSIENQKIQKKESDK